MIKVYLHRCWLGLGWERIWDGWVAVACAWCGLVVVFSVAFTACGSAPCRCGGRRHSWLALTAPSWLLVFAALTRYRHSQCC